MCGYKVMLALLFSSWVLVFGGVANTLGLKSYREEPNTGKEWHNQYNIDAMHNHMNDMSF